MNCAPAHIGRRELMDTYIVPFQAAIRQAGLHAIMNAYRNWTESWWRFTRHPDGSAARELGFDGLVVSDYEAIKMIYSYHFVAKDPVNAARLALTAGIDVELPNPDCYSKRSRWRLKRPGGHGTGRYGCLPAPAKEIRIGPVRNPLCG